MADFKEFRVLLLDRRRDALRAIAELGGTIESIVSARASSNSDDEHDPEGATLAFERSQSDALLRQAEHRLIDIDASLARIDAGTYGSCMVCGTSIPRERLRARPDAGTCIDCA
jgi:RNA polymerase-binding transcription factor DksA